MPGGLSKGGMVTKLMAAQDRRGAGRHGDRLGPSTGRSRPWPPAPRCTWFTAKRDPAAARKHWIGGMKPAGALVVDAGAASGARPWQVAAARGRDRGGGRLRRGDPVTIRRPRRAARRRG
jgi:glutamate 5-kinase